MSTRYFDRVKETTTTTGTGNVTLAGAATGFRAFSAVYADGDANIPYCIAGQNTAEWEVGLGTYNSSGTTLSRNVILASSNAGAAVSFSAGTKDIFVTLPANLAPGNIRLNAQTGSYTIVSADRGNIVQATGSTAQTLTLDTSSTLANGWFCQIEHAGTGTSAANQTLTITPTSGTIDGLSSIKVYPGDLRLVQCDGTNFVTKLLRGGFLNINAADSVFTFTVPTGFANMQVDCWGGGGSGGGGNGEPAGNIRAGGGGGGGSSKSSRLFSYSDLSSTVSVTVGAGGTSSAGGTSAVGTDGKVGGNTTFGSYITSFGGGGGSGGIVNAAGGGGGGGGSTSAGSSSVGSSTGASGGAAFIVGATGGTSGNAGTSVANNTGAGGGGASGAGGNSTISGGGGGGGGATTTSGGSSQQSAGGGGGGGNVTAATPGTSNVGSPGGNTGAGVIASGGGGTGGSIQGGNGSTATQADVHIGGQGGGGGAANNAGTGGAGATGTVPGGGGGGGGGGTTTGGASGAGGAGAVRIWYWP